MKILVAIANHGTKHQEYLDALLREYRSMPYQVDFIVLSNIPKELGPDVRVVVGCPWKDPWALPFPHKKMFAEKSGEYDLFIYSEDDTLIRQSNIQAFLTATEVLPEDRIAGFMRYEVDAAGQRNYSTVHLHFHWVPNSVERFGAQTFARFTNDHSACYLLTRKQLKKAIASGGYLVEPHMENYDLLVSAATDPYTQCGFRKVICVSDIEDSLVHHLPNQYLGKMGIGPADFQRQIDRLLAIAANGRSRQELFPTETNLYRRWWSMDYYERVREDFLAAVPEGAKRVLSVGCGWGEMEGRLVEKGLEVVGIPIDSVISACAESRGVRLTPPNFEEAFASLAGERFDAVMFPGVLHHIERPFSVFSRAAALLAANGRMIVSVPNFNEIRVWRDLLKRKLPYEAKRDFQRGLVHFTTRRMVQDWYRRCGLQMVRVTASLENRFRRYARSSGGLLNEWLATEWIFVGRRA